MTAEPSVWVSALIDQAPETEHGETYEWRQRVNEESKGQDTHGGGDPIQEGVYASIRTIVAANVPLLMHDDRTALLWVFHSKMEDEHVRTQVTIALNPGFVHHGEDIHPNDSEDQDKETCSRPLEVIQFDRVNPRLVSLCVTEVMDAVSESSWEKSDNKRYPYPDPEEAHLHPVLIVLFDPR